MPQTGVPSRELEGVTRNLARLIRLFDDRLSIHELRRTSEGARANGEREGHGGAGTEESSSGSACARNEAGDGGNAREGRGGGEEAGDAAEEVPVGVCSSNLQEFLDGGGVRIRFLNLDPKPYNLNLKP
jgi:hypothetical protein